MHHFNVPTRDPGEYLAELNRRRFEKLKRQIAYLWGNEDYFRPRFVAAGVTSPNDIRSFDDFRALPPFMDKASHRASQEESLARHGHPFGLHLTAPLKDVIHLAATSGTTGQPTWYAFTRKDQTITNEILARLFAVAGVRPGDTTFHAFGLSLWLAGITFMQALEAYGARPVAVGAEGGISKILRYIEMTRPRALFATPSLVAQLIERAPDEIGKPVGALGIEILFCSGEPGVGLPAFRDRVTEAYGARIFDVTGGAWHNGTISCGTGWHGMHHLAEDYCFRYDLVDPVTRAPIELKDGAVGEALHTALEYEAAPAFRNATGDILRLHVGECPGCGQFGSRIEIIGRADDMLNVKGVKVYPSALQDIVTGFLPHVSGQLRIRLDGPPPRVNPPLKVVVEAAETMPADEWDGLARAIEQRSRDILALRPAVTVVPFGTLPRSNQKTKLVEIVPAQS
jgi:phenylacetate-CoA ligase